MAYDRSKGRLHEKDHSHKHEKDFRVAARRNKLLGLWAAELMNIRGPRSGIVCEASRQQRFGRAWR